MKTGGKIRDLGVVASYVLFAVVVLQHLWGNPSTRMLTDNTQDQTFFEWVLTHAARVVTHGESPIFTDELNSPLGVNLMANTSILGLALPLSPITLLFGAGVTFALVCTLALAGTAAGWYIFLSRVVVRSKGAAYLGGLFCGFAPAMISQITGHPNIAGQYLIPFIVWAVFRLRDGSPVRRGLVLAALVVYQCFINEEILFLTACALGVFLLVYLHPREILPAARAALPALGVTAVTAGVLLAYPLYHQFFGPQAYHGLPDFVLKINTDLASFTEFSRRSIVGDVTRIENMGGATEENSFFGWPLMGLLAAGLVVLIRHRAARALYATGIVFAVLSLGIVVKYRGEETSWHGPWEWVHKLPLFDSVVPTRLALVVTPVVGVIIALIADRLVVQPAAAAAATEEATGEPTGEPTAEPGKKPSPTAPILWAVALAVALVPLVPTPQPADERSTIPAFFTTGEWKDHIPKGGTVVVVPGGWWESIDAMRYATSANLDFSIAGGYFLAPDPNNPERKAMFGPAQPATMDLLAGVANDGAVPQVSPEQQEQARADARYWKATTIVLADQHGNSDAIRQTVDQLYGPGRHVTDVWLWDVR
ncbi:hypothetical protein KZZ52_19165 [Dactylosporangium sp. AC04546]|uniref:hypothetical protein n=1 Tax=Dactylosporangium sp. AC04546 TaxID=2862460 RepID=UPI001EE08F04|nr:hypothetical protein [Dactylosporangium sp. AC04546]WVK87422.1 hypothetical protein KZZ52_19165 [Dactylosporangium sp. AC04546]